MVWYETKGKPQGKVLLIQKSFPWGFPFVDNALIDSYWLWTASV